jgi:hypothetical protein
MGDEIDELDGGIVQRATEITSDKRLYLVKVSESKELVEGFKPIKEMIYQSQRIKMLSLYKTLLQKKINIYGFRTDCLYTD